MKKETESVCVCVNQQPTFRVKAFIRIIAGNCSISSLPPIHHNYLIIKEAKCNKVIEKE